MATKAEAIAEASSAIYQRSIGQVISFPKGCYNPGSIFDCCVIKAPCVSESAWPPSDTCHNMQRYYDSEHFTWVDSIEREDLTFTVVNPTGRYGRAAHTHMTFTTKSAIIDAKKYAIDYIQIRKDVEHKRVVNGTGIDIEELIPLLQTSHYTIY